jgi:hypothetical protein
MAFTTPLERTVALLALGCWATTASATCPDPATYDLTTMPDQVDHPLTFDCVSRQAFPHNDCDKNIVVYPQGVTDGPVMLWLAGTDGTPDNNRHVLNIAGFAGYRVIAPSWDNGDPPGAVCSTTTYLGGPCTTDCTEAMRRELITGTDETASPFVPERLQSLSYRIGMLIDELVGDDLADNGVNDHGWEQLCTPDPDHGTAITWSDLVVAGHSMGGNQATYISYAHATHGAFIVESGYDVCEAATITTLADIYDPNHDYNDPAWGEPVSYYTTLTDQSPGKRVFAMHKTDPFPTCVYPDFPPSFTDHLASNPVSEYDVEVAATPFTLEEVITTSQWPVDPKDCTAELPEHQSLAIDQCMPTGFSSEAEALNPDTTDSTSSLYLFETYLEAMCSLY